MPERAVNPRQLEVLRWIVDGRPDGVMAGASFKTTAVALQSRRLVEISRKGGTWSASATSAGCHYAEHGVYPDGHWAIAARSSSEGTQMRTRTEPSPTATASSDATAGTDSRVQPALRPVDQMMADLAAAGGTLTVTSSRSGYWEGLVSSATRHDKVPDGKLLHVERGSRWEERVIRLADRPSWMTAVLEPVAVSQHLRNPHAVVARLRDDKHRLTMKAPVRSRALRILDALAKEAVARGHRVTTPARADGHRHARGHLEITVTVAEGSGGVSKPVQGAKSYRSQHGNQHHYTLVLDELKDRVPHVPTATELREKERYSWKTIPSHDQVPSGRLRLKVIEGWKVRQEAFSDTKATDLAERLGEVLQEVELRADAAERLRLRRVDEAAHRRRRWERVRDQAVFRVGEQHRARVLMGQAEAWRRARELDDYLAAMTAVVEAQPVEAREQPSEWLEWVMDYRARLNPLAAPLRMPTDPDITAEALKPFMQGLSPYGPA